MFKNRFLLVLGVFSLILVTMAISRPFSSTSVSNPEAANDFYQRHPNWSRNLEASDYHERHPELSAAAVVDIAGDFALRHPGWTISVQNAALPETGMFEASDYFQRHPEMNIAADTAIDMAD